MLYIELSRKTLSYTSNEV